MKKIRFSIKASVIYTVIGAWVSLSNLAKKAALSGKSYNREFGSIYQIGDGIKKFAYDIMISIFGVPMLATGLIAGILSCIALHIYNKNYEETHTCKTLSIFSIYILASSAAFYMLVFVGILMI